MTADDLEGWIAGGHRPPLQYGLFEGFLLYSATQHRHSIGVRLGPRYHHTPDFLAHDVNGGAVIQSQPRPNPALQQHLFERRTPFDFTVEMRAATTLDESHAIHNLQFVGK